MALCNQAGALYPMADAKLLSAVSTLLVNCLLCCDLSLDELKGVLQMLLLNEITQR